MSWSRTESAVCVLRSRYAVSRPSGLGLGVSSFRGGNQHGSCLVSWNIHVQWRDSGVRSMGQPCNRSLCADIHSRRGQLNFFTNHKDNPLDQIFVFFSDEKSVGVKTMRKWVDSSSYTGQTLLTLVAGAGYWASWRRKASTEESLCSRET